MKVRSNINAGFEPNKTNHNEKIMDNNNGSVERGKSFAKKLNLKKETIRELRDAELKGIAAGMGTKDPSPTLLTYYPCTMNHNEKIIGTIERGKSFAKKLSLKKETIRELRENALKQVVGGRPPALTSDCDTRCNC